MIAFIFDRDGVILDSESTNVNAAIKAFKAIGINITKEEQQHVVARYPDDYIKFFDKKYDFSYIKFRSFQRKAYYELLDTTPFFEPAIAFIHKLKSLNITLALTTSSNKVSTANVLNKAGLNNVFDLIVTYEDCTKRKPDPEPYIITAKKLNINPSDCIVIEDSEIGLISAKAAGMRCIVIPNKYTKDQDFRRADLVVDSALDIDIKNFI